MAVDFSGSTPLGKLRKAGLSHYCSLPASSAKETIPRILNGRSFKEKMHQRIAMLALC